VETNINLTALKILADNSGIPFIIAWYWRQEAAFQVETCNTYAEEFFTDQELLTEADFVERMYKLRRLKAPIGVLASRKTEIPEGYQRIYDRQQERKAKRNA
jgi:hypothetical protein